MPESYHMQPEDASDAAISPAKEAFSVFSENIVTIRLLMKPTCIQ